MNLKFAKMHGLGNDFIVIDGINQAVKLTPQVIQCLSNRHTGVGFDQCLVVEKSDKPQIDFFYRIFNSDGNEVGQCGNGARCLALFIQHYQLSDKNKITVETHTTQMQLTIHPNNQFGVTLPQPSFDAQKIPLAQTKTMDSYTLELPDATHETFHTVNVGNPHALLMVEDINKADVANLGKLLSCHPFFPEQTNVGFMERVSPSQIKLRVYERGVGETQACGSGAVAAAAVGRQFYQMDPSIDVQLLGGGLNINWPNLNEAIQLTGSAHLVYEGKLMEEPCAS